MSRKASIDELMHREVLTISELVARAKAECYPISGYAIRCAVKSGALPCRKIGRKTLICWSRFVRWVTCADDCDNPPVPQAVEPPRPAALTFDPAPGIHRIAVGR